MLGFKVVWLYLQNLNKKCTRHYQCQMTWKLYNDFSYLRILYQWFVLQVFKYLFIQRVVLQLKLSSWHNLEEVMVLKLILWKNTCRRLMVQSLTYLYVHTRYKQKMIGKLQCPSLQVFKAQALFRKKLRSNFSNRLKRQFLTYL